MNNLREDIFKSGLSDTIKQVNMLKEQIINANNDTMRDVTSKGVEIVNQSAEMIVFSHEDKDKESALDNSGVIVSLGKNAEAWVINGDEDAVFIEFGTGMVGKSQPHPTPSVVNWQYYIKSEYKRTLRDGRKGWWYGDGFVEGLPSMPFMYLGAEEIRRAITDWFSKNLERRIKV